MYYPIFVSLLLAMAFLVAGGASALVLLTGRLLPRALRRLPSGVRAEVIFLLRVLPVIAAVFATLFLVVPGFLILEPGSTGEQVSPRLWLLTSLGFITLSAVVVRAFRIWSAGISLRRAWKRNSTPLSVPGISVPVSKLEEPNSVLAVTGILRPRVFVSANIVSSLTEDELRAALGHELAHVSAADNLKQVLLRISSLPRFLGAGFSAIDRLWLSSAEVAADEGASHSGASCLDLASALVKVGRMKSGALQPAVASHFIPAEAASELPMRVAGLEHLIRTNSVPRRMQRQVRLVALLAICLATYALTQPAVLSATHELMELLVQ